MTVEISDPSLESLYQQLLAEFPKSSPDAIESALQLLNIATNKHVRLEALFSEFGFSSGRFALLMLLRHEPSQQLPPSEMATRARVSRATMTQFLDHLERDGFIKRVNDPNDRRALFIQLTPHAQKVLKDLIPLYLKDLERLTSALNRAERKQFFSLLEKLNRD
jgi:DNA-binding MarR family transcriptional regulator